MWARTLVRECENEDELSLLPEHVCREDHTMWDDVYWYAGEHLGHEREGRRGELGESV